MRTRQAAWRYVQTTVRPQDRVAIFTATGKDQLDFTSDQAKLHDALYRTLALPQSPSGCPAIDDYEAYLAHILNDPDSLVVLHTDAIGCVCSETVVGENRPGKHRFRLAGRGSADPCPPQAERQAELEAAGVWARAEAESLNALDAIERICSPPGCHAGPTQCGAGLARLPDGDPGGESRRHHRSCFATAGSCQRHRCRRPGHGAPQRDNQCGPSERRGDQDEAEEDRCRWP